MEPNVFGVPFKWTLLLLIGTACQAFLPLMEDQFDIQTNTIDTTTSVTVRGVIGGRVLLPCDVTAPNPSDSAILVLFYTESKKTPIYSLDSRGLSLYSAQHWSDPDLQGRVNLQVDYGNQGLLLQKVRSEDEGLYRCRVDFKASPTRNSKIILDVIEPPRHLLITSKWRDERVVSKVAGPFPEGAELTLSCQVMGGDPPPQVTWWHEGALLDDITETRTNQMTRNSLQLPPLTRTDLLKKLTCQAVNSNLTTPLSATVEVDLAFPPTSVKLKYSNEEAHSRPTGTPQVLIVSEGEPNPLKCEVEGSRPQAVVSWTINGKPISDKFQVITNPSMYSGFPETAVLKSTLMLIPEARDKDSEITCQAVNPQLPDEHFLYDHAILNVLYKPRIKLTEGKKINLDDVKEGNDIYFECEVDANPPAQKIVWAQNGKELTRNPSKGVLLSSSGTSLILQDVTRAFSGTYTCTAVNEKGSTTSNNLTMNVKFIPVCSSMNGSTIGGGLQEAVKARCKVDSHPPATHFRWAFNSTRGLQDISDYPHVILNDSSSVLEYNIKSTDDFGAFLCWASNALGNMKEPCIINVIPAAKPESVSGCEIFHNGSIPGGRVLIQCVRGWDGGLAQSFTLEVRKAAHYKTKVLSALQHSKEPAFYISDLQAGEKYLFTVTATNSRGESVPVTLFHTVPGEVIAGLTHAHTDPQKSFQRYMPLIAVALGITMTIFASIGIVICIFKFRSKKKNDQLKKTTAADSLTEGDSSMQSIVGHCIKEKDNINNCNSLSCYDDCSTYNSTLKSQESILYHTDLRTLPMNQHYMHQRENQSLLTAPGDQGNTYIGTEELTVPECQHFLPLDGNSGELSNSLGRTSTLSSGSTAPSTFRDSQTTIVYNPKYSFDERKTREELNPSSWRGIRDDVQL